MQILQETNASSGSSAPSQSATFPSPVTEGSALHVIAHWYQPSNDACTFRDSQGNEYTILDTLLGTNSEVLVHAYAANVAGGATTVEVDFAQGDAQFPAIWAREIGPAGYSPLLGHAIAAAASTTESASASNASQPALLSAFGFVEAGGTTPATTSPLIQDVSSWNFSGAFGNLGTSAHELVDTTGAQSAEFTTSALGNGSLFSLLAIFTALTSLTEWDVGSAKNPAQQARMLYDDGSAKCMAAGHLCLLKEIYPVTLGSGTLSIQDDTGAVVFTAAVADMTPGVVIRVYTTGDGVLTVTSFPSGGQYGVSFEEADPTGDETGRF